MTGPSGGREHGEARASRPEMNKDCEEKTSNSSIAVAVEKEPRLHGVGDSGGGWDGGGGRVDCFRDLGGGGGGLNPFRWDGGGGRFDCFRDLGGGGSGPEGRTGRTVWTPTDEEGGPRGPDHSTRRGGPFDYYQNLGGCCGGFDFSQDFGGGGGASGDYDGMSFGGGRGAYHNVHGDFPIVLAAVAGDGPTLGGALRAVSPLADAVDEPMKGPVAPLECMNVCTSKPMKVTASSHGVAASPFLDMKHADLTRFTVLTWNCCGLKQDGVEDIISLLDAWGNWDVLLVHEGPCIDEPIQQIVSGGHLWCLSPKGGQQRSFGALLHRRWHKDSGSYAYVTVSDRVSYLDLDTEAENIRFINAHVPHSLDDHAEFEGCLEDVEGIVSEARQQKRLCVCGLDANAALGGQAVSDDVSIIGKHGFGDRNARGHLFSIWLHRCRLAATSTMFRKQFDECWTHRLWSSGTLRQIDYVLIDSIARGKVCNVGATSDLDGKSDHRLVFATFAMSRRIAKRKRRRKPCGWKPRLDESGRPASFHECLDHELGSIASGDAEALTAAVVAAAAENEPLANGSPAEKHGIIVQELMQSRRAERNPEERKRLSKLIWRALRQERQEKQQEKLDHLASKSAGLAKMRRALNRGQGRVAGAKDKQGVLQTTPANISEVFAAFYEQL